MLVLPDALRSRIAAWAAHGRPRETCGLLIGRTSTEHRDRNEVVDVHAARNLEVEHARERFELDPADFLAADAHARALGLDVVGVWHSHVDRPARPSESDRASALRSIAREWSYVVVAVRASGASDAGELRSWRLDGERFVEEEVRASSDAAA